MASQRSRSRHRCARRLSTPHSQEEDPAALSATAEAADELSFAELVALAQPSDLALDSFSSRWVGGLLPGLVMGRWWLRVLGFGTSERLETSEQTRRGVTGVLCALVPASDSPR